MLPWLLVAAGALAAPAPSRGDAERAAALERRSTELSERMDERTQGFLERTTGLGALLAELDRFQAVTPRDRELKEELTRVLHEWRDASVADAVQATLIARRLQAFRETGVLPPEVPDDGSIEKALRGTPPAAPPARDLPLDLVALSRELGLPPPPGARREKAPAPAPAVARRPAPARVPAGFMPDRGTGRPAADPLPGLIADLSANEPSRRALAADELAGRGAAAVRAVPALRAALEDPDPRVRSSSVTALGAIVPSDSEAVADMRRLLTDRDEDVRFSARAALRRLGLP